MKDMKLDTTQIVAEAAKKVLIEALPEEWRGNYNQVVDAVAAIIQAAIEEATEELRQANDNLHKILGQKRTIIKE